MQGDEFAEADLVSWNRRLLSPFGIWPKANRNLLFAFCFVCCSINLVTQLADFVRHIDNLEEAIAGLSEGATLTLLIKMQILYKNRILCDMIDVMNEDIGNIKFRTSEEQAKYGVYYSMAKFFFKIAIPLTAATTILFFLKPLAIYFFTASDRGPGSYALIFRARFFYEITDVYTYAMTFTYQTVALCIISTGSVGGDGMLVTLTLHLCGQLSILVERIKNFAEDSRNAHCFGIESIVKEHLRLIRMAKQTNKIFSTGYFVQLLLCASLICLNGIGIVASSDVKQTVTRLSFAIYQTTILTVLFSYCFIGECLIKESQRVRDAFYQCNWFEMTPSESKDLIICIAGSEKPLYMTAGKFCHFSLELFTQVLKASTGYISVLRTLM